MTARMTHVARFDSASIPTDSANGGGVVVLRLGDGTTMRATTALVGALMLRDFSARLVAYDVDDAGNRYNARLATLAELAAAVMTSSRRMLDEWAGEHRAKPEHGR